MKRCEKESKREKSSALFLIICIKTSVKLLFCHMASTFRLVSCLEINFSVAGSKHELHQRFLDQDSCCIIIIDSVIIVEQALGYNSGVQGQYLCTGCDFIYTL